MSETIVTVARELLAGQVPTVGMPSSYDRNYMRASIVSKVEQAVHEYEPVPDFYHPAFELARCPSLEHEQRCEAGDPETLRAVYLEAIAECVALLCQQSEGGPVNNRLRDRLEWATLQELKTLLFDLDDLTGRAAESDFGPRTLEVHVYRCSEPPREITIPAGATRGLTFSDFSPEPSFRPRKEKHCPGHIRDTFTRWLELEREEMMALDDYFDEDFDVKLTMRELLDELWRCTDVMPGSICEWLGLPCGSMYGSGARVVKATLEALQERAEVAC